MKTNPIPKGQAELETKLMSMVLFGDDPVLAELRNQYQNSRIVSRKFSGVGFFTSFKVELGVKPLTKKNFEITDIVGNFNNTLDAIGFVLFVRDGYIDWLEGYTLALDFWPEDYSSIKLYYNNGDNKHNYRTDTRDLMNLKKNLGTK